MISQLQTSLTLPYFTIFSPGQKTGYFLPHSQSQMHQEMFAQLLDAAYSRTVNLPVGYQHTSSSEYKVMHCKNMWDQSTGCTRDVKRFSKIRLSKFFIVLVFDSQKLNIVSLCSCIEIDRYRISVSIHSLH